MGSFVLVLACACCVGIGALLFVCGTLYVRAPVGALRTAYAVRLIGMKEDEMIKVGLEQPDIVRVESLPGFATLLLLLHEDDLFFCHGGINVREVLHRLRAWMSGQDGLAGGSSISQQLAKHLFSPRRKRGRVGRWWEKLRELVYALKLERLFTKEEIITLYLNSIRFGPDPIVGIRRASDVYCGKSPTSCALHEFLFLFGLIPAPSTTILRILKDQSSRHFPTRTAFIKCVDLMRLIAITFGWGALERLDVLSFRDIIALAREMKQYTPRGLPDVFELALEARAIKETARLDELVRSLAYSPKIELVSILENLKIHTV